MERLTIKEGEFLVREARTYLESYLSKTACKIEKNDAFLNKKCGLFVTLHTHPDHSLRGCIGFTEPVYALKKALAEAARSAANDPRFPKVTRQELDNLVIEISILTPPKIIPHQTHQELLEKITQKKDGLIIKTEDGHGLFLPQVWEQLTEKIEFLQNLCYKAGLFDKDAWQYKDTEIYSFRVQIFEEKEPKGKIIEVEQ
ncbi:MAG: TIGR00296 family protein [archaeon]